MDYVNASEFQDYRADIEDAIRSTKLDETADAVLEQFENGDLDEEFAEYFNDCPWDWTKFKVVNEFTYHIAEQRLAKRLPEVEEPA